MSVIRAPCKGYLTQPEAKLLEQAQVVSKIYSILGVIGFCGVWGGFWGWMSVGRLLGALEGVILLYYG